MKVQQIRKIYRLQIIKDSKLMPNNRGIKTYRTIKTKLPLQFCMNDLTIIIRQLVLSLVDNMKTRRKDVNKVISRTIYAFY